MREISFKTLYNGELIDCGIIEKKVFKYALSGNVLMIQESIGELPEQKVYQYTGLTDCDGNKIYEGHIIKDEFEDEYQVFFARFELEGIDISNNDVTNLSEIMESENIKIVGHSAIPLDVSTPKFDIASELVKQLLAKLRNQL